MALASGASLSTLDATAIGESVGFSLLVSLLARYLFGFEWFNIEEDKESFKEINEVRLILFLITMSNKSWFFSLRIELLKLRGSSSSTSLILSELMLPINNVLFLIKKYILVRHFLELIYSTEQDCGFLSIYVNLDEFF